MQNGFGKSKERGKNIFGQKDEVVGRRRKLKRENEIGFTERFDMVKVWTGHVPI